MPQKPHGTYSPKPGEIERHWHVIDADDIVLGRLASQAAALLRGKHKPQFALHVDTGDFVVVVNAAKVAVTGAKLNELRYRHSGYPGGLSSRTVGELLETKPERVIELAALFRRQRQCRLFPPLRAMVGPGGRPHRRRRVLNQARFEAPLPGMFGFTQQRFQAGHVGPQAYRFLRIADRRAVVAAGVGAISPVGDLVGRPAER